MLASYRPAKKLKMRLRGDLRSQAPIVIIIAAGVLAMVMFAISWMTSKPEGRDTPARAQITSALAYFDNNKT